MQRATVNERAMVVMGGGIGAAEESRNTDVIEIALTEGNAANVTKTEITEIARRHEGNVNEDRTLDEATTTRRLHLLIVKVNIRHVQLRLRTTVLRNVNLACPPDAVVVKVANHLLAM